MPPKFMPTPQRIEWITYLLDRAYPVRKAGKNRGLRAGGSEEFKAELDDQPDNVLEVLYDSAKRKEQEEADTPKFAGLGNHG